MWFMSFGMHLDMRELVIIPCVVDRLRTDAYVEVSFEKILWNEWAAEKITAYKSVMHAELFPTEEKAVGFLVNRLFHKSITEHDDEEDEHRNIPRG